VARDEIDVDHILPLSLGGETAIDNLRVTHKSCNRSRGNRDVAKLDKHMAPKLVARIERNNSRAGAEQNRLHDGKCNVSKTVTQGEV
jgi:5-methylcytosine-specific restriction endonuclease McrA